MAYTTINKSTDYFNTKLYTGTGSSLALTGVGHQPDMVWQKVRSTTSSHRITDAVRGVGQVIYPNDTAQQSAESAVTAFGTDGFTVGTAGGTNTNGATYVGWSWKANGAGSSNSDGSISSTVSANTTAGFSIVKYTGTGSAATVGHGLSTAPKVLINKALGTQDWFVGHSSIGFTKFLKLNETNAESTNSGIWNDTAPTSSVFTINSANGNTNSTGVDYITYCFAEKTGYSNFGSYVANGSNDGAFCYTGFKPGFIMIKSSTTAMYWHIFDNKRLGYNAYNYRLNPNANEAETTTTDVIDILSNGFKIRTNQQQFGTSGATYIYMAFAEAPLVGSNNIPCTAR